MIEVVMIVLMVLNIIGTIIVKFNDMKHLSDDVKKVLTKVDDLVGRVSDIEGQLKRMK